MVKIQTHDQVLAISGLRASDFERRHLFAAALAALAQFFFFPQGHWALGIEALVFAIGTLSWVEADQALSGCALCSDKLWIRIGAFDKAVHIDLRLIEKVEMKKYKRGERWWISGPTGSAPLPIDPKDQNFAKILVETASKRREALLADRS